MKEKQSVSLSEVEKKIVRAEDARLGLDNFSATLRKIIREWDELKRSQSGRQDHGNHSRLG